MADIYNEDVPVLPSVSPENDNNQSMPKRAISSHLRSVINRGSLTGLIALVLLLGVAAILYRHYVKEEPPHIRSAVVAVHTTPHIMFADYSQGVLSMKDTVGNTIYTANYSSQTAAYEIDTSSGGEILLATKTGSSNGHVFILLDKTGKTLPMNDAASATLSMTFPSSQGAIFLNDNTLIAEPCTYNNSTSLGDCKLVELDVHTGYRKVLVDSPSISQRAQNSISPLLLSTDRSIVYILTQLPTKFGAKSGFYAYNLSTGVIKYLADAPYGMAVMSPDGQKTLSWTPNEDFTATLRIHTIATGQDRTVRLPGQPFMERPVWSPNSDKVLYFIPDTDKGDSISVVDAPTGAIINLQSISPTSSGYGYSHIFWVDETHITYELGTRNQPSGLSSGQIFEQDLITQKATPLTQPESGVSVIGVSNY